ncbi:MAG: glycosyltransferase family 2 protein [Clostridia bacterium]|nr:glycosyltransferase family 2 protein [Clostridia bacterium]
MSIAVSVLVPVYNVENTLRRCVESILNQTFKDFEIILVNDGSTDNSGSICDEYAQSYSNIRVIHKKNEGLGPTRNIGIKEAKGDFIYHCDSDDWLKEDLLEKAYAKITATNSDVVVFGYDIFTERNGDIIPFSSVFVEDNTYTDKNAVRKFFAEQYFNSFVVLSACNRMYRRAFVIENSLYFPELRRSQDVAYSLLLFNSIERLATIKETYYCYIIEPGVYKGRSFDEMIEIYSMVYDWSKDYFTRWGLIETSAGKKLIDNVCEQIANYSAYAFTVKYQKEWKKNAKKLVTDEKIRNYFSSYSNEKKSRFMSIFSIGIKIKSPILLLWISKMVRRKIKEQNQK